MGTADEWAQWRMPRVEKAEESLRGTVYSTSVPGTARSVGSSSYCSAGASLEIRRRTGAPVWTTFLAAGGARLVGGRGSPGYFHSAGASHCSAIGLWRSTAVKNAPAGLLALVCLFGAVAARAMVGSAATRSECRRKFRAPIPSRV